MVRHAISPDSFHFPFSYQKHFAEASPAVICKTFFFMKKIMHKHQTVKERIPTSHINGPKVMIFLVQFCLVFSAV